MASSSERGMRRLRALAGIAVAWLCPGCLTGALVDAGRHTETVVRYEQAWTDGARLWLVYASETANRAGEPIARGERTATVTLGDLDPARGLPLDAVPATHPAHLDTNAPGLRPVRLVRGTAAPVREPTLFVEVEEGRDAGLTVAGFEGLAAQSRLDSGSLVERETAGWVYPLLPVAAAADAVAVPPTLFFAIPFFVVGD
jgi:hypothetical protein